MTPIHHAQGDAFEGPVSRLRRVAILLGVCRPFAIVRRVMAIVVDTFNGPAFWAWTHVGDEVLKIIPSLTYRDATAAISRIVWIVRAITTSPHGCPTPVFLRGRGFGCGAVLSHLAQICESMIRLTSSAIEMPSRFACFLSNSICGSVNETICFCISKHRLEGRFVSDLRQPRKSAHITGYMDVGFGVFTHYVGCINEILRASPDTFMHAGFESRAFIVPARWAFLRSWYRNNVHTLSIPTGIPDSQWGYP